MISMHLKMGITGILSQTIEREKNYWMVPGNFRKNAVASCTISDSCSSQNFSKQRMESNILFLRLGEHWN